MIFLGFANHSQRHVAYLVGIIPVCIGVALLVYIYVLAPKQQ